MNKITGAFTWWVTPGVEDLDAKVHRVTLPKGELAYIDDRGKHHKIAGCEGDLVQEYVFDNDSSAYYRVSLAEKRYDLLGHELTRAIEKRKKYADIAVSASAAVLISIVMDSAFPPLALVTPFAAIVAAGSSVVSSYFGEVSGRTDRAYVLARRDVIEEMEVNGGRRWEQI